MPLFAALASFIGAKLAAVYLFMQGTRLAYRMWGLSFVAGIYISCVVLFTTVVADWWTTILSTDYGMLLGLLFPPVAGTVLAGMISYWGCVIGVRYISSLTKAAVK